MPNDSIDYDKILEALQTSKDVKALVHLYGHSRKRLFGLAYSILKDEENAKDLVQEFFIDFWGNELFHRVKGSLKNYLARSVWNRAINYSKKKQILDQLNVDLELDYEQSHLYRIENQELNVQINRAIDSLTPMTKKVFIMHYIHFHSYADISAILGITKSSISSHMDRALKKLRADLKKIH